MEHQRLVDKSYIEQNMLRQLMEALRVTLAREEKQGESSDRIATLRFIMQSFQRHLERMMSLEEDDGYLGWVVDENPRLNRAVAALREEHDRFRAAVPSVMNHLAQTARDGQGFNETCAELLALLRLLDEHRERESVLLQEAVVRDGGGEG